MANPKRTNKGAKRTNGATAGKSPVEWAAQALPTRTVVKESPASAPLPAGRTFWRGVIAGRRSFEELSALNPVQRSDLIESGVPAALLTLLSARLDIPREQLYATLGVKRATVDRKIKAKAILSTEQSEGAVGIARLIGQVAQMVRESGNADDFDAARWVAEFLEHPNPALGGRRPAELMRTSDGRSAVAILVAQMQSGAYA